MTIEEKATLNLQYERNFLGRNLSDNMVCRAYCKGATEQKDIDDAELAEVRRERDEYYDELTSKRQRIADLEAKERALRDKLEGLSIKAKLVADDVMSSINRRNEAKGVICVCREIMDFLDNYGKEGAIMHYYVIKDGRTISDFNNYEEAYALAQEIGGEIAKEEKK